MIWREIDYSPPDLEVVLNPDEIGWNPLRAAGNLVKRGLNKVVELPVDAAIWTAKTAASTAAHPFAYGYNKLKPGKGGGGGGGGDGGGDGGDGGDDGGGGDGGDGQ